MEEENNVNIVGSILNNEKLDQKRQQDLLLKIRGQLLDIVKDIDRSLVDETLDNSEDNNLTR